MALSILDVIESYLLSTGDGKINENDKRRLILFCDDIAGSAYKTRYQLKYKPRYFVEIRKEYDPSQLQFEQIADEIIEYEEYFVRCWESMTTKFTGAHFGSDVDLKRYLYSVFSNDLEQMIYDLTPGLHTRVRQMKLILPQICDKVREKEWRLKDDYRLKDLQGCNKLANSSVETPPEYVMHNEALGVPAPKMNRHAALPSASYLKHSPAVNIPAPKVTQTREDSERGPSIKKEEMLQFLVDIINVAGGVIQEKHLIEFIKHKLSLISIAKMEIHPHRADDEENDGDLMDHNYAAPQDIIYSQAHELIAQKILSDISPRQRQILKLNFVEEMDQTAVAKFLDVSNATVSSDIKSIGNIIGKYKDEEGLNREECAVITELLLCLIGKEGNYEKEID